LLKRAFHEKGPVGVSAKINQTKSDASGGKGGEAMLGKKHLESGLRMLASSFLRVTPFADGQRRWKNTGAPLGSFEFEAVKRHDEKSRGGARRARKTFRIQCVW